MLGISARADNAVGRIFKSGLESVTGDLLRPDEDCVLAAPARLPVQVGCVLGLNAPAAPHFLAMVSSVIPVTSGWPNGDIPNPRTCGRTIT